MSDVPAGSIVIAHDHSDHGRRALAWGLAQAEREHRPVDVVHALDVTEVQAVAWVEVPSAGATLLDDLRATAATRMEETVSAARAARPGVLVRGHLLEDAPRRSLVDLSTRAHLLVLGSHGRGPVLSPLLGSVSAAVVRHTACPTVVVRPPRDGASLTGGAGVMVGVDGTAESRPVVAHAFAHAALHRLPLTVVHCVHDLMSAYVGDAAYPPLPDLQGGRAMLAESVAGLAEDHPDVEVVLRVERGLLEHLVDEPDQPWDLVVVGGRQHSTWHRMLVGSTTTSVLEHATCPVAVVPEARGA